MTLRPPLTINAGQPEQLPFTDSLLIRDHYALVENDNASPLIPGTPVYVVSDGVVDKAQANNLATAKVFGLAVATINPGEIGYVQMAGLLTLTTTEWDAVFADLDTGLQFNADYFLVATSAGVAADTVEDDTGNWAVRLGRALSDTTFHIDIQYPIGL